MSGKKGTDKLPGKDGQYIRSGTVRFYAQGKIASPIKSKLRLGPSDWLYVEIGYAFHIAVGAISKDKQQPVHLRLYASFYGRGLDEAYAETTVKTFPTEAEILMKLHHCIKDARREILANAHGPCREAVRNFKVPPM